MVPFTADADTVIRSEDVDLFPFGSFDDASEWTVWSNKAYSEDVAEYSTSMVADGRLSMTHDRPANYNEITAWATNSPTGDNLSIGQPDCFKPVAVPEPPLSLDEPPLTCGEKAKRAVNPSGVPLGVNSTPAPPEVPETESIVCPNPVP